MRILNLLFFLAYFCIVANAGNRKVCIDSGWQYIYGQQATMPSVDAWKQARVLNLPHDWSVETDAASQHDSHVGPFSLMATIRKAS